MIGIYLHPYHGFPLKIRSLSPLRMIADHFIDELGSQNICMGLPSHRTQLDDIHANDTTLSADLPEKMKDLIPVESAGLWRADGWHLAGVKGIQIDGDIGMRTQAFPRNSHIALCQLISPHNSNIWLGLHEFRFFS